MDVSKHLFRALRNVIDKGDVYGYLKQASCYTGYGLDVLYIIKNKNGFDIGESSVVIGSEAGLPWS